MTQSDQRPTGSLKTRRKLERPQTWPFERKTDEHLLRARLREKYRQPRIYPMQLSLPAFRNGNLNPCPAHPATYKPTKYPTCRQCLQIRTNSAEPPTGAKPMSTCAEQGCQNQTILPEWLLCEAHWDKYTKGYPDCENPPAFCTVPKCKNPTSSVYRLCHPHWLERQDANRERNQQPEPKNQGIQQQNSETSVTEPKEFNAQIATLHQEIIEYHRKWERRYNRDTERIRNADAYASAAREINLIVLLKLLGYSSLSLQRQHGLHHPPPD